MKNVAQPGLPILPKHMPTEVQGDLREDLRELQSRFNITTITPQFLIGGQILNPKMLDQLCRMGVNHIMCVAEELVDRDIQLLQCHPEVCFYAVYWQNKELEPAQKPADFLAAWEWYQQCVHDAIFSGECLPKLYIHCGSGMHRAPTMMAFILSALSGDDDFRDAWTLIHHIRPVTGHHGVEGLIASGELALKQFRKGRTAAEIAGKGPPAIPREPNYSSARGPGYQETDQEG